MGKKKQSYACASFHFHLSNKLRNLPRKLTLPHLHTDPLAGQITSTEIEGAIFDSFRSLGLSDCNLNNDQLLEPAQSDNTVVMVPPSDRFFVSPSTSGSLAWDCNAPLQASSPLIVLDHEMSVLQEEDLTVRPSYRFFVSCSTSGLITLDQRVKSLETVLPSTSSNSTHESVIVSSFASNSPESISMMAPEDGTSSSSSSSDASLIPGDGIAVSMDSDDPYRDFKRSMQEMLHDYVEARRSRHRLIALDWNFLEELLFCYLERNDQSVHRYIIKAFADVVVAALRPPCCQLD